MTADLLLKGKNSVKCIVLNNINSFAISDTNGVLYTYDPHAYRKVSGIYSKTNLYGIINHDNMVLYPDIDEYKSKRLNLYEVFIPEFNDKESLIIAANGYDHNTYTNEVSFKIIDGNRVTVVAIINLNNVSGFKLYEYTKPEVID